MFVIINDDFSDVKIEDSDIWSLYHTLALIILPSLKKYKKSCTNGFPTCLLEDDEERAYKKWMTIIDKMIWSFSKIVEDDEFKYYLVKSKEEEALQKQDFKKRKKLGKLTGMEEISGFIYIGKYSEKKFKEFNDKMNEGLFLFGKYFRNLWD
jgi:hypothetical protein